MAGTFGSQLAQQTNQAQSGRLTRTQRLIQDQKKRRFTASQQEAQRVQSEVFTDRNVEEKYTEYVPRNYIDYKGRVISAWYSLTDRERSNILKGAGNNVVSFERTRTVNQPFTFDIYTAEYEKLNPEVKQFFTSPEQIRAERQATIRAEVQKYDTRITQIRSQIASIEEKKQARIDWYNSLTDERRERMHKSYVESIKDFDAQIKEYNRTIGYSGTERNKIEQGASAEDVLKFGESKAEAKTRQAEQLQNAIKQFDIQKTSGTLASTFEKLGMAFTIDKTKDYKYQDIINKTSAYNKDVAYKEQIFKWGEKVGFNKLPEFAQKSIGYEKPVNVYEGVNMGVTMSLVDEEQKAISSKKEYKPTTEEEKISGSYARYQYAKENKGVLDYIGGFVKKILPDKAPAPPRLKMIDNVKTSKAPIGMGGKGTAVTTEQLSPEFSAYALEFIKPATEEGNKASDIAFEQYSKDVEELASSPDFEKKTLQEKQSAVDVLKKKTVDKFREIYTPKFEEIGKNYEKTMKEINFEKKIEKWSVVPFSTKAIKWRDNLEKKKIADFEVKRIDRIVKSAPIGMGGKGTVVTEQTVEFKAGKTPTKEIWGSEEEIAKKNYERYRVLYKRGASEKQLKNYVRRTKTSDLIKGTEQGIYKAFREDYRTIAFDTAVWTGAIAGATVLTAYSGGAGAVASSKAIQIAGYGLAGLFAGSVVIRTAKAPTFYQSGTTLGEITATEILPMTAGGFAGVKLGQKVVQYTDLGLAKAGVFGKYRSAWKFAEKRLLTGEEKFLTMSPHGKKAQLKIHEKNYADYLLPDQRIAMKKLSRQFKVKEKNLKFESLKNPKEISYNPSKLFKMETKKVPSVKYMNVNLKKGEIVFNKRMKLSKVEKTNLLKSFFGEQLKLKLKLKQGQLEVYQWKGGKQKVGANPSSHASPNRKAFKGEDFTVSGSSSEYPAMSLSNAETSVHFLELRKGSSYSLVGSGLPIGKSPVILKVKAKGFKTIPSGYKPKLPKATYEEIFGIKIPANRFKQTAYMLEKAEKGTGQIAGEKPEIENLQVLGTKIAKTKEPKYYTRITNEKFYKKLEQMRRYGYTEFTGRVQKFSIRKPATWIDKAIGRKAGTFKATNKGIVVPVKRFEAMGGEIDPRLLKKINELASIKNPVQRQRVTNEIKKEYAKQSKKSSSGSSRGGSSTPITYPFQYASYLSYKKSYGKSYNYSKSGSGSGSSRSSYLRSAISSLISSKSSKSSFKSSFSGSSSKSSKSYLGSSFSYKPYSPPKPPYIPIIKFGIKGIKQKVIRKLRKTPEIYGLTPDFTSRALGLAPKQFSVKQAIKEMKRVQTGFEVRTGGRIKGFKPMSEKNLMMGIMK